MKKYEQCKFQISLEKQVERSKSRLAKARTLAKAGKNIRKHTKIKCPENDKVYRLAKMGVC